MTNSVKDKRSHINVAIEAKDKKMVSEILDNLGMNMSTAINIYLKQIIKHNGIPFDVVNDTLNEENPQAFKDAKEDKNLHGTYSNMED